MAASRGGGAVALDFVQPPGPSGRLVSWAGQAGHWDDTGDSIVEHVAGVDDFEVAEGPTGAAVARWPTARITLRQGIRVVHDTR
jgi:hypothetical protein